ncbi:hypothetical protein TRIP_B50053 [uncultured Desulfatiglans sp.]|uniref:Uncharacterized protein n=1 Tax=Uncultured Desulfatiglans sp. TaxID=1748965 RepID=A0A653AFX8_UNCDX|nr:hypothetical protein TRIP_B50053 [uncultured Desulfatiglans sp.]
MSEALGKQGPKGFSRVLESGRVDRRAVLVSGWERKGERKENLASGQSGQDSAPWPLGFSSPFLAWWPSRYGFSGRKGSPGMRSGPFRPSKRLSAFPKASAMP